MKLLYSIIIFLILNYAIYSQDSTNIKDFELRHGIQFQISGLITLSNFNNYTFAYQYLLNKKSGIRIGIFSGVRTYKDESETTYDTVKYSDPSASNDINLELSIQYLYRLKAYKCFNLMVGGGPLIGYHFNNSQRDDGGSSYTTRKISESVGMKYGFDIILGVEYQFKENIVFSGEYDIHGTLEKIDYEETESRYFDDSSRNSKKYKKGKRKYFRMDRSRVNLGITLFF